MGLVAPFPPLFPLALPIFAPVRSSVPRPAAVVPVPFQVAVRTSAVASSLSLSSSPSWPLSSPASFFALWATAFLAIFFFTTFFFGVAFFTAFAAFFLGAAFFTTFFFAFLVAFFFGFVVAASFIPFVGLFFFAVLIGFFLMGFFFAGVFFFAMA
ncbi:MAG: hypothetical protein ACLQNE_22745 [Thermoguttaceae bacterium]